MSADVYAWWRAALAGSPPPLHESEPVCGYFRVRDRRGANKNLAPIKRPFIACAIWRDHNGELCAELAGDPVSVGSVWPWCAKHPIPYEHYQHWHEHGSWPQEAA